MKARLRCVCKLAVGWLLILLGIVGWLLPVVPGTPFIVVGLAILSTQSEWLRNKIESLKLRFPRHAAKLRLVKESLAAKIRREGAP